MTETSSDAAHEGGCLCGAIRYRVAGAPLSANICYCTQCQRQTGAAMPAFVSYALDRFRLLAGEPATYRSSPAAVRQFCASCGSSLFWRRDGADELDLFLGTLDEPVRMKPPDDQIWVTHRMPWVPPLPGVAAYPRERGSA
jgi:hypothetical protein